MSTVCAWCMAVIREREAGVPNNLTSHGICQSCRQILLTQEKGLPGLLAGFNFPIVVLNESLKPVAMNPVAAKLCHRVQPDPTFGQLIGCSFSHSPDACGNALECSG